MGIGEYSGEAKSLPVIHKLRITTKGVFEKVPAVFGRIDKYKDLITETLLFANEMILKEHWQYIDISDNRLLQWCQISALVAGTNKEDCKYIYSLLRAIFGI